MKILEAILAFFIGFCLGYIIICLLDDSASAVPKVRCYYDSTIVSGSALARGWYCK